MLEFHTSGGAGWISLWIRNPRKKMPSANTGALAFDDDGEDAEVKAAAALLISAAEAVCALAAAGRAARSGS
jgi:hypothetical protein